MGQVPRTQAIAAITHQHSTPVASRNIAPGRRSAAPTDLPGWSSCGRRVSILHGAVLPTTNGTGAGEEREMSRVADISEPASDLERLIADLSESGRLVLVSASAGGPRT
jgi:hypothetical protein